MNYLIDNKKEKKNKYEKMENFLDFDINMDENLKNELRKLYDKIISNKEENLLNHVKSNNININIRYEIKSPSENLVYIFYKIKNSDDEENNQHYLDEARSIINGNKINLENYDRYGWNALHWASYLNIEEIVDLLIKKKVNIKKDTRFSIYKINNMNNYIMKPLDIANFKNNDNIVKKLNENLDNIKHPNVSL